MKLTIDTKMELNNRIKMPILGLGTWKITGKDAINAVKWALEAGYRHIDTARLYNNETQIGNAIKESGISREDIFITSKFWDSNQGYQSTIKALDRSFSFCNIHRLWQNTLDLKL